MRNGKRAACCTRRRSASADLVQPGRGRQAFLAQEFRVVELGLIAGSVIAQNGHEGVARPHLEGTWFEQGFHGAMAELLCAIEEDREPYNGARSNLESLALCFAAVESAHCSQPVVPGTVRQLPEH